MRARVVMGLHLKCNGLGPREFESRRRRAMKECVKRKTILKCIHFLDMKVGILINNAAQFVNGSEQQPQFVIEMLQNLGISYTVYSHRGKENLCGIERSNMFNETRLELIDEADLSEITVFIMICHIVEDTSSLSAELKDKLADKKVVQFHCGNHCIFNAEDIVFDKHNVVRLLYNSWFTELWTFSMHFFAKDYYELLTKKPCKLMPYSWSPSLLSKYLVENHLDISCAPEGYSGPLTLCCFEPNLNVTKTCQCPLLIMDSFYRKYPSRVHKCFIFCAKQLLEHKSFKDFIAFLEIVRDDKVEFYPRMAFPEIMKQMKERQLSPVIVGHQIYNDQNYLSLEAIHLGYPIVHNSPSIQNAGFFYPEFNLHQGFEQLEKVSKEFYKPEFYSNYQSRARKILSDHHTGNPVLLEHFFRLLS